MTIEPKDSPKSAEPTPTDAPLATGFVRKLDHPYFELRTPDSQANSYVEGNAHKMITAAQEKLGAFLAEARLAMDQSSTPRKRSIQYNIPPEKFKNARPMDALPPTEFAAFEAAAKDFYDKASPDRKDIHPYETFLRLNFRLPDPDREPDAYLVYGEDYERRLLVLWGCEKEKDSALPLTPHAVVHQRPGAETVTDKLRRKMIGWEQMQRDALLLLAKTREPLFRFIGQAVRDENGELKGVKLGELALPNTRPLRYLLPPEMKLFHKACQEFYARAATAKSPYEKELRKNFQLPDPDKMPDAFRVQGPMKNPRLIVLFDGTARRDDTIWLTPAPDQNIPPMPPVTPEEELLGQKPPPPPTLTDKLKKRVIPFHTIATVAAVIVGTPILAAFLIWFALDKSPPYPLKQVVPGEGVKSILVRFNEPIDPSSLPKNSATMTKSFVLLQSNGVPVTITAATLVNTGDYKAREIKLDTAAAFVDGDGYRLAVNGLADRAMLHNQMRKATEVGFVYADNKRPVLGLPASDGENPSHLVLPFSKPMDPDSIADTNNYSIDGSNFKVVAATLDEDKKSVLLTVVPELPLRSEHTLIVKNVKDVSHLGNKLDPNPTTNNFTFLDILPPKLRKVAPEEQNKVVLEFNKTLNAATVTNLANYALVNAKDGSKLEVYAAQLEDTKKIALFTTPLFKGIDYDLAVTKIGDMAEPSNLMNTEEHRSFTLPAELENHSLPSIDSLTHTPDRTKILVSFGVTNRLRSNLHLTKTSFQLLLPTPDGGQKDFSSLIAAVADPALGDFPQGLEKVGLTLSGPLEKGQTYIVSAKGLQDIWGNSNSVSDKALKVKGFTTPITSGGCRFANERRRDTIRLALNWKVDDASLAPSNWGVTGGTVASVMHGENDYVLVLKLKDPLSAGEFIVSCNSIRMADSNVESGRQDFHSDRQR